MGRAHLGLIAVINIDIFISHAWRFHGDYQKLIDLLDEHANLKVRNFGLPWYDPALNIHTEEGGNTLRELLRNQIIPAQVFVLLSSVFANKGARKWVDFELEYAKQLAKPVVALPNFGEDEVPLEVCEYSDRQASWEVKRFLEELETASSIHTDQSIQL